MLYTWTHTENHAKKPKHHVLTSGDQNWKQKQVSASEMASAHPEMQTAGFMRCRNNK